MTCTNTIFPSKRETIPSWIHIFWIILFQCLPWRISGCGDTPMFEVRLWFEESSTPSHKSSQFQTTPILNCCFCHPRFILKLELLVFLEWLVEENRKNLKRLWYGLSMMMRMRMIDVCLCIWSSPLEPPWPRQKQNRVLPSGRISFILIFFLLVLIIMLIWAHDGYPVFLKCTANWL